MARCALPRSNPDNQTQYVRQNGPYTLVMSATTLDKLPFGANPRLILAWICTEAVRTRSRDIVLGRSLSEFMRKLGIASTNGRTQARLRNQMMRLFSCSVSLAYTAPDHKATAAVLIADTTDFWWNPKHPDQTGLWESKVRLSESFFNEIVRHPVPLDLYLWLVYRTFSLKSPQRLTWKQVYRQFGVDPDKASDNQTVQNFRLKVLRKLKKVKLAWPDLNYSTARGVLIFLPSVPHISPAPGPGPALISP